MSYDYTSSYTGAEVDDAVQRVLAPTVDTYALGDVSSGALVVDISNAFHVLVVINEISLSVADKPEWRLAQAGGASEESGSVYDRVALDDTTRDHQVNTREFIGPDNVADIFTGRIRLYGAGLAARTPYDFVSGIRGSSSAYFHGVGHVDTTTAYSTLKIYAPSGSFDALDLTVFKY